MNGNKTQYSVYCYHCVVLRVYLSPRKVGGKVYMLYACIPYIYMFARGSFNITWTPLI